MPTTPIDITLSLPPQTASPNTNAGADVGESTFGQHLQPKIEEAKEDHEVREDAVLAASTDSEPASVDRNEETDDTGEIKQTQNESTENDDGESGEVEKNNEEDVVELEEAEASHEGNGAVVVGKATEETVVNSKTDSRAAQPDETNSTVENDTTKGSDNIHPLHGTELPADGEAKTPSASTIDGEIPEDQVASVATLEEETAEKDGEGSAAVGQDEENERKPGVGASDTASQSKKDPSSSAANVVDSTPKQLPSNGDEIEPRGRSEARVTVEPSSEIAGATQIGEQVSQNTPSDLEVAVSAVESDATGKPEIGPSNSESNVEGARNTEPAQTTTRGPGQLMAAMDRTGRTTPLNAAEQGRFVNRVVKALEAAQLRGGEIRLRLHPPELGALRLEVRVEAGALHARLEAETPQARNLLIENLATLRERLAEQNVRVEQFDVDLMDRQPQDRTDTQQNDQQRSSGKTSQVDPTETAETDSGEGETAHQPNTTENDALNVII